MIDTQTKSILTELLNFSLTRKLKLFVVGGTLRDHLLHKNIGDIDLAGKNAAELGTKFAQSLSFNYVSLDKTEGRATTRIILPTQQYFDLTDMQGDRIEEDLIKRDFTINAMGQELSHFLDTKETILDLCESKEDLKKKIIRTTSNSVFKADPLRMLRAFRLAATLNFSISQEVLNDISLHKNNISLAAGERIWSELVAFFKAEKIFKLVNLIERSGLFSCLFPVVFKDWDKVLNQFQRLENLISNPAIYFPKHTPRITNPELLKLSLLLNEIEINSLTEQSGKNDFGNPKTYEALKTLKASNNEITFICKSIQNLQFLGNSLSCSKNDSYLYDLCLEGGEQLIEGLLLHASTLSITSESEIIASDRLKPHSNLLEFYFTRYLPILGEKALLNGNDIIKKFNIAPSPTVGEVLKDIQRAQVLGEIKTSAEAEKLAAKILNS